MHKIIISNVEVDLSDKKLTITEENSWFSDNFFTKYSYPFSTILTKDLNVLLGDLLSYDSATARSVVECKYVFHDKIESAVLNVEEINDSSASVSLQYGMDDFPNFDKNLKELNLFQTTVSNIYTHANQTVSKNYPQTNYNFPMIHTDKYDVTDPLYNGFEQIINKRTGNIFVQNVVQNNEMLNKNIIQPMPYLMYVLKKGFEMSGRVVEGNILQDPLLNKMLIFSEKEYVSRIESSGFDMQIDGSDLAGNATWLEKFGYEMSKTFTVTQPGYYNIIGEINIGCLLDIMQHGKVATFEIVINGVTKYVQWEMRRGHHPTLVDLFFDLRPGQTATITINVASSFYENVFVSDLQCLPVYYYDTNGNKLTNLFNSNTIDLNKAVPDITFGTFFNIIMNWFNYDVDEITEDKIVINKINHSFQNNEILDLSRFDNISVKRKKEHDNSFIIKYSEDGEVDLGGMYLDKNTIESVTKDTKRNPKNTIEINAYVLQNETISGIRTAKSNKSSEDKLCVVVYDGLNFYENTCKEPSELQINNVVNSYHYDWMYNRVHTQSYIINFTTHIENIMKLNTKKRVYAYNNVHLCKSIQKTEVVPDVFEVEIETEIQVMK